MKRRAFFGSGAAGLSGLFLCSCGVDEAPPELAETWETLLPDIIAGKTREDLLNDHRMQLFEQLIPWWESHGFDYDYGGFWNIGDSAGTVVDTGKDIASQGQALWAFSFLYNRFGKNERHLEIARQTRDFVISHMRAEGDDWYNTVSREGSEKGDISISITPMLTFADGLAEYALASGSDEDYSTVVDIIWAATRKYDNQLYQGIPNNGGIATEIALDGFRSQEHSMLFIRLLSQFLSHRRNSRLETVLDEHIGYILNNFYNSQIGITNEYLQHDYTRVAGFEDYMHIENSVRAMWIIMLEAIRRGDRTLFTDAKNAHRRYLEIGWDYVFEGLGSRHFYVFDGAGRTRERLYSEKSLSSHCDLLIGLMHAIEFTGEHWALDWCNRISSYSMNTFKLDTPPYTQLADRFGRPLDTPRVDLYSPARRLMLNIQSLERMIDNEGYPSAI